jgi:hypothetical protein
MLPPTTLIELAAIWPPPHPADPEKVEAFAALIRHGTASRRFKFGRSRDCRGAIGSPTPAASPVLHISGLWNKPPLTRK